MNKTYNFCNNCGKEGHSYQNCKLPITSLGIIALKENKNYKNEDERYEYLMICRKDSLGFVDFMRGKYPLHNKEYLINIFNEMTVKEKNNLLKYDFATLWKNLWGNYLGAQYRGEEKISKEKYNSLKNGITIKNEFLKLEDFINNSTTTWEEPEWGFPKGRRNFKERDIECAIREFEEETCIKKFNFNIINNVHPVQEIFTGSNYKSYKHKYFIALMQDNYVEKTNNFQKSEVSKLEWKTFNECIKSIRPYNLEKINIVINLNKSLKKYTII